MSNAITMEPIPAFEDNYIWALRYAGQVAIVDPGEAAPVRRFLERSGDRLAAILVTHRHGDHIGGIAELVAQHPLPVYGPVREAAEVVTHPLRDGDHVTVLGMDFEVLEVPGHTLGHIAFYATAGQPQGGIRPPVGGSEQGLRAWGANSRPGVLFCGDTLFGAGCGRVFEGTLPQMQASLARLATLPPDTQVYCAHEYTQSCLRFAKSVEPDNADIDTRITVVARQRAANQPSVPSTLAEEFATNPFLRWASAGVIRAATTRLGHPPANDAETFGAIRVWRDSL